MKNDRWPALPLDEWVNTCETLHLYSQIVGKVRLELAPRINHWWQATFYVNARGLTTSAIPYEGEYFEIQFDFIDHRLDIITSRDARTSLKLEPKSVAEFSAGLLSAMRSIGIEVAINMRPQELPESIPFDRDDRHASYDSDFAHRFWRALLAGEQIMQEFRARYIGKCSPVHFFWGSFDLACTRFSGRPAPPKSGVISREAYSHECCSAGWWPGQGLGHAAYYSYTSPMPEGLSDAPKAKRFWNPDFSQFQLAYDEVRTAKDPSALLLEFLQSTYEAGAELAHWDRAALER